MRCGYSVLDSSDRGKKRSGGEQGQSGVSLRRLGGESIASFVLRMIVVGLHPVARERVHTAKGIKLLPQLDVLYWFVPAELPALGLPSVHPLVETFDDILAVGIEIDGTRAVSTGRRFYRRARPRRSRSAPARCTRWSVAWHPCGAEASTRPRNASTTGSGTTASFPR